MFTRSLGVGVLALLAAVVWQAATVEASYGGNWTALFGTGDLRPFPPELEHENIYVFPGSYGFDGQLYHYIAHDPFFRLGLAEYQDDARLRYRRILVPLLAYTLTLGNQRYIDVAYSAVCMGFLFLGTWWLAAYATEYGYSPFWGLGFLVLPATIVTIDRLTVDVALAALCVAFALEVRRGASWRLWVILAAAPMVRETGLLLTAGYGLWLLWKRNWRPLAPAALSVVPSLGWYVFVQAHTQAAPIETSLVPFSAILRLMVRPPAYPDSVPLAGVLTVLDVLALAGMLLAFALAAGWLRRLDPLSISAGLFAILGVFLQREDVWVHAFGYARFYTPLLLLLGIEWLESRRWLLLAPLAMILPRMAAQFGKQVQALLGALYT